MDHPRSRGVYVAALDLDTRLLGSSPLARGLLSVAMSMGPSRGIIPARAGFTSVAAFAVCSRTDHPRSRGVYVMVTQDTGRYAGSSPLARGLLHGGDAGASAVRIIPARAGFT